MTGALTQQRGLAHIWTQSSSYAKRTGSPTTTRYQRSGHAGWGRGGGQCIAVVPCWADERDRRAGIGMALSWRILFIRTPPALRQGFGTFARQRTGEICSSASCRKSKKARFLGTPLGDGAAMGFVPKSVAAGLAEHPANRSQRAMSIHIAHGTALAVGPYARAGPAAARSSSTPAVRPIRSLTHVLCRLLAYPRGAVRHRHPGKGVHSDCSSPVRSSARRPAA